MRRQRGPGAETTQLGECINFPAEPRLQFAVEGNGWKVYICILLYIYILPYVHITLKIRLDKKPQQSATKCTEHKLP